MKYTLFFIKFSIVLFMFAIWIYFFPVLPEIMPIHWNYAWVADNFTSKNYALFLFPAIALIMLLIFQFLPKIDPKKENYPKFEKPWEIFQLSILTFFAYAYYLTIYASLFKDFNIWKFIMFWIWILFIILWNYMWKIRKNYFVWIRLPWTIENEEVWNKTHRLWWKMFMLWWALFIINSFLNIYPEIIFTIFILIILVIPIIYSYVIFKKIKK